jgi:hypothetical protein
MSSKIGRNDLCPCGSGKKNKRCHNVDRLPTIVDNTKTKDLITGMETYVRTHESKHILNEIIGMQLLPENHGKNIRIEKLAVLTVKNLNNLLPEDTNTFQTLLRKNFSFNNHEDPTENLFTENVIFFGGNHITFPGIASHPVDIFRHLTHIIFNTTVELPDAFRSQVYQGLSLLLYLGDWLSQKTKLTGNIDAVQTSNLLLSNPIKTDFSFSHADFAEICKEIGIHPKIINDFIIDPQDERLQDDNLEFTPLLFHPIITFESRYYYMLISNQTQTLNEYVFRLSAQHNCQQNLMLAYREELWAATQHSLYKMGWHETDIFFESFDDENAPKEAIFHFDQNRLAYVILDTPLNLPDFLENPFSQGHPPSIQNRIETVISDLKSRPELSDHQFLILYLHDSAGRNFYSSERKPAERELRLAFSAHDFITLSKGEDWSRLSLWKFAKALNIFRSKVESMAGTIELYSMYKHKSSGFYFSDDATPDYVTIVPGEGSDLLRQTKLKENFHAAPIHDEKGLAFLPVISSGNFAPIYKPQRHIGYFIQALEGYQSPIWLINHQVQNGKMASTVKLYTDAVGFWLSKLSSGLSKYINPALNDPLKIIFEFDLQIFQEMTSGEMLEQEKGQYNGQYSNTELTFYIPSCSLASFIGGNNDGEREMMKSLLQSFNLIDKCSIPAEMIESLVDKYIPLGQAKMILITDSEHDFLIDRRWMIEPFLMTDAEIELLLDEIPVLIEQKVSIPENIETEAEKKLLFNSATAVLLEKLKTEISVYDHQKLLTFLLNLHETLIHKRESDKTIIPAQLLCFGGMEEKVDEIMEENSRLVRTTVSLRNLIEFLAAQPISGKLSPGFDGIDRLLALMHEITNFGLMSDAIHFKMDDPIVGKLPSGRIGFTSSLFKNKMTSFSLARAKANIEESIEDFEDRFEISQRDKTEVAEAEIEQMLDERDNAFLTDWGISYSNLYRLSYYASVFCIEHETSVITMSEKEFSEKLITIGNLPEKEIVAGLERLSLFPREEYLKAPESFVNNDVFPWKYNREFSLTRRFLIRHFDQDGNTLLTWGFRGAIAAHNQLLSLFLNTRLNNGGEEIKKLIAVQAKARGTFFRNLVKDWLIKQDDLNVIDYEVDMSPGGALNTDKTYGDVDILVLHKPSATVFSIECKNTTQAKNIHEMKTEMDRYLGREQGKGMIDKHVARHAWLSSNTNQLQKLFKVETSITVKSLMISSEVIPTPYIKSESLPMPIIAFQDLKREGVSLLLK